MYKHIYKLTDNVEGETITYKHKFSNLEKSLKDLSQGSLFQEIEALIAEVRRLTEMNSNYEVRYFLLAVELERRSQIIANLTKQVESYRESLMRKDREHTRELERIREEETRKVKKALELEIDNLKNSFCLERSKWERRLQELESELQRKDLDNADLRQKLNSQMEFITTLKIENEDLKGSLRAAESQRELDLNKLQADLNGNIKDMENKHRNEIENLRRVLGDEKQREFERQNKSLQDYYNDLLSQKETDLLKARQVGEQHAIKGQELESEINGLKSIVSGKNKEIGDLREQQKLAHKEFQDKLSNLEATNHADMQSTLEKMKLSHQQDNERHQNDLAQVEGDLQNKKNALSALQEQLFGVEKLLEAEKSKGRDMNKNNDNLQQKLKEAQDRLLDETTTIEETYTIKIEEKNQEITRLLLQIKELHDVFENQLAQERNRADNLASENEFFKKENAEIKKLSDVRAKEIEEWRQKYSGYVTGDEALTMKDRLARLQKENMNLEDIVAKMKIDIARLNERNKQTEAEIETRDEQIVTFQELNDKRKDEVIRLQEEINSLTSKLRNATSQRDNEDADKMLNTENLLKMQREIQHLKEQCDMYKRDYEKSQVQLVQANQKYAENLKNQEEVLKTFKNPSVSTVRSSQVVTKSSTSTLLPPSQPQH